VTWTYRGPILLSTFQEPAVIDKMMEAVRDGTPVHLAPLARNFPSVDSIIHDPKDSNVVTCIQITMDPVHAIEVSGLKRIEKWLESGSSLEDLRPTTTRPWRFLFVVPLGMAPTFELQKLDGDTDKGEWAGKVDQYVLGLKEETIFGERSDSSVQRVP
jgi:hypothetical protein